MYHAGRFRHIPEQVLQSLKEAFPVLHSGRFVFMT